MKVVLSTIGKFHTFDLARQLLKRGVDVHLFSGYPRFKLRNEGIPAERLSTRGWYKLLTMGPAGRYLGEALKRRLNDAEGEGFDRWISRELPECDVFMGLSGCCTRASVVAKSRGAKFILDRGSSHMRYQERILREEYERWGIPFAGFDPSAIARDEEEYESADVITVPSSFAMRSFLEMGVPREKLRQLAYGVDLSRFRPVEEARRSREGFHVLFVGGVSVRKGIGYLVDAFRKLRHPRKSLTVIGSVNAEMQDYVRGVRDGEITFLGARPQAELKNWMSRAQVMVLPSVEEGLALVQGQAMACGCPVIGTTNTGAEDLFSDGVEGFVIPIRDVPAIADRLQLLADDPQRQQEMSAAALVRTRAMGGWDEYGEKAVRLMTGLCGATGEEVSSCGR